MKEPCIVSEIRKLIFRTHAIQRMFQRRINETDVRYILTTGENIEAYPDDTPYPSRLVLGWIDKRPLHIVVSDNEANGETIVITVYEPDPEKWSTDFKRRIP
jgi:hypothetical protein